MKTLHVGLTGNMGSGKSTVAKLFEFLEIPVYYSDKEAKVLMYRNKSVKSKLKKAIGKDIYLKNGRLNRLLLAEKIFNNPSLLQQVNEIVHPAVREDYLQWREKQKAPYTLQESALTFETKAHKVMDATIVVYAPLELLIKRVMERDNTTRDKVLERLNNQMSQEKKVKKADYLIDNSMAELLMPQVREIHQNLLSKLGK